MMAPELLPEQVPAIEPEDTRGLSQRELILTLMRQVEKLNAGMGKRPTRMELWGTLTFTATVIFGIVVLL